MFILEDNPSKTVNSEERDDFIFDKQEINEEEPTGCNDSEMRRRHKFIL